jgi:hypothetical protein
MTRIERIAPFLEALSDEEFDELLSAASYAAGDTTVYQTLSPAEKAEIGAAIDRLDAGMGVSFAELKARLKAKLGSSGA